MNHLPKSEMFIFCTSTPCAQLRPIILPNHSQVFATDIGTISLFPRYIITNVLFIPNFHFNLLSVNKLTHQLSCAIIFSFDRYLMQDVQTKKVIGMGRLHNGLYILGSCLISLAATSPQHKLLICGIGDLVSFLTL